MIEVWLVGDPLTTDIAEVGYLVARAHQRRGIATAALHAACDFAFASLGVRRLEWRAVVGNEASRRVAIKAGFTIEGTQRANLREGAGDPQDAWVGARLAPASR